ncbi:carbohydrate ABC transporter substrate-binding protein [Microbacterium jejuense]|uniref:Carbohydrate ABC transporter substrate-binding protein n=1 Tax=Microbacterium jejuense TaxID=1263637 RepID=A0ABS7HHW4_9MICO|nr:ABC transporter substrate-binding protein [Microbacterium jejuense]MBW9092479.1 carbohydrate ABC transporter substrate-binding protein [Microbacterium jejuense]
MNARAFRRSAVALAAFSASAIVLAGCASGSGDDAGGSDDQITLTVATFNDFGYTKDLLAEYTKEHPNIKVVHNKAATSNDARANYFQKLGKKGLSDIEAIEVDWLPEVMKYSDLLAPVPEDLTDRWLDWKVEAATDPDGNLIGYGTDIGPEAVCYRQDLFEAAGLPTDPADVAAAIDGDWSKYFALGEQYTAATGEAFFDSAGSTYQGMINQVEAAYEDPENGDIIATENPEVKDIYDQVLAASATQSAHLGQWSDDWYAGMSNGAFATLLCPGWMLGQITGNAPDTTGWNIANVFPNGGGNWGGSYLTVPANGPHVKEAQELADWLTAPEQQIKAFENAGTFPSQVKALESDTLLSSTNEYFNNAPVGQIFTDRANAVTVAPFKGEYYFQINDAMQQALTRVEDGTQDAKTSWDQWVSEVDKIG